MTDQTKVFRLERVYLALNEQDPRSPAVRLLARTPGLLPEQLAECRRLAVLLPPLVPQRTPEMPGALGLFRGETIDFILAKAQAGPTGDPVIQYLLLPAAVLRGLGGNIRTFEPFARELIPQFQAQRTDLPPFVLDSPEPADAATQTDDLLALIGYCKNNLKLVGNLLAALIQAMPLGVINAPPSMHDRLTFIQGLLTLLPTPARTVITFATSVLDPIQTNPNIKFMALDMRPPNHLIFDWAAGKVIGDVPEDTYTKFIMAQLRLDTSLVIEQTERLSRTAVWRATRKDDMANALAWVSRRASLDSAVENGLPADRAMVASVLREDPTLPDDLRATYTRHLLAMTLALDDPAAADVVPPLAVRDRQLGDIVFDQLRVAAINDQPMAVYHLIERWLLQPPMGVDIGRWRPLLGMAALARNNSLLTAEAGQLSLFLEQFLDSPAVLQIEQVIAQMVAISRKRGYDNADVARAVFLLSATYLPAGGLQRLLAEAPLLAQLPEPLRQALTFLAPNNRQTGPYGLLAKAAEVYGPDRQPIILARLVEWAALIRRLDLIDAEALRGLIKVAALPLGRRFDPMFQHIIEEMSAMNVLKTLDARSPQYLVELCMAQGRYVESIRLLEYYQANLYKDTNKEDLAQITHDVFCDVPLSVDALNVALNAMQDSQLKPIARANAFIGAMEGHNWGPETDNAARQLTAILVADPRLTEQIGTETALRLLKANAERKDTAESLKLAGALVGYALSLGEKGTNLVNQVYPLLNWSAEVNESAVEILRMYVRRVPMEIAKTLPPIFGEKHGSAIERSLDATVRLRYVLDGSDFLAFTEKVHAAITLLVDMATAYHPDLELPPIHKLRRTVEGMPGGLSEAERHQLASNLNIIGLQILKLTQAHNRKRGFSENENVNASLLAAMSPPMTGIDALRWLGGFFAEGQLYIVKLEREARPHLLGNRSVNILLRESTLLVSLFDGLLAAFPDKDPFVVDLPSWTTEVNSVWGSLSLYRQRHAQPMLSEDAQLLAQLTKMIGDRGHERTFQPSGYGRQLQTGRAQPRSVLDALRWLSGYFDRQHN